MLKLVNKIVLINGRRTSMRMSNKEWHAFDDVCKSENISRNELLSMIEKLKDNNLGLTYSTRLFILSYFRQLASNTVANNDNFPQLLTYALQDLGKK